MTSRTTAGRPARCRLLLWAQALCALAAVTVLLGWQSGPVPTAAVASNLSVPVPPYGAAPAPPLPAPAEPEPEVTLAFGGDVHFEGGIGRVLERKPAAVLGDAAAPLLAADLAVVNLETAVTSGGTAVGGKEYAFRAPPTAFSALRAAGVDTVTMANNHALDYGRRALVDAVDAGAAAGVPVIGAGRDVEEAFRPYVASVDGQRVAVIAATQVLDSARAASWTAGPRKAGMASAKDPARLLRAVRDARSAGGIVAVYLHWGQELRSCPPARAKRLARQLVEAGADVVVGTHAHVPLADGYLDGAYVHSGLGNLAWYTGEEVRGGVLTLTLRGRTVTDSSWLPVRMEGATPVAAEDPGLPAGARTCSGLSATRQP